MAEDRLPKTFWFDVQSPFSFSLTTVGNLTIEFAGGARFPLPVGLRCGIEIPLQEVQNLARFLGENETILETLSARAPTQGAH